MRKSLLLTLVILLISSIVSVAQCAMCTKTAAGLDSKSATGLNNAIIYLAIIPFSMLIVVLVYIFKLAKQKN
ncbi:MAG: hypothetical protein ORN55_01310 [Chitinophagaceae bacterium]|jgi:hypothetical protein|nr:hypothetical protein [Chitinophagaceae bacterium]